MLRQFGGWLVKERRAWENPFENLKKTDFSEEDDQVRPARVLEDDEVRALIETAENGPDWRGIPGKERALVYLLCNESGLRAKEVLQLIVGDFDFENKILMVRMKIAKGRKGKKKTMQLPLKPLTAELIREHVETNFRACRLSQFRSQLT